MPLSSQALKKAIESYQGDNLAQFIVDLIYKVKDIETKIQTNRMQLNAARHNWEVAQKTFSSNLTIYQSQCKHPSFSYWGDPAGGSDSFNECDICGKHL